jgi:tRNA-2-methylthio-N6-dimethylallyladenosine synthase
VLIEKPGRMPGQLAGKSDHLFAVHLAGAGLAPGALVPVRIVASGPNSLEGQRLDSATFATAG